MEYADLNQPQTITPPTSVQPYSQFQVKLHTFEQGVQNQLTGQLGGAGSTATGATGSGGATSTTGSSAGVQAYSQCIQAAHGDVSKMQRCAPLLSGSGG